MFTSRIARPSDYESVARLCRRSVGRGDYALKILKQVINKGGLYLAFHGRELVGMTNFEECIDGSGWLGMARTDPEWRGRGVAVFLQRQIARRARQKGIRVLRLWTASRNRPAIKACLKGGFRPVCEAAHISCNLRKARKLRRPSPLAFVSEKLLESILGSSYIAKMKGYLAYNWHIVKASRPLIRQVARKGELYSVGDAVFILTRPTAWPGGWDRRSYGSFTLLSGRPAQSLKVIKETSQAIGLGYIGSYIPYNPYLLKAAKRMRFRIDRWGAHCIVFEKRLL